MKDDKQFGPISVVITTYNDGLMLGEALRSVASQTVSPREILVIDDGSEPATAPRIIETFEDETGLSVKYVWQNNAGPSAARNTGLRYASQDFIAYLDADDYWLPSHLEQKLKLLNDRSTNYSTAYGGFTEFDNTTGRSLPTISVSSYDGPIQAELLGVPNGVPAGMPFQLHRRDALLKVGGFDHALMVNEDFDLLLRLGKAGYRITGSGKPTVMRRVHPRSQTRVDPQRTLRELERFLAKAEREKLLPPAVIAGRRKWARLSLGKLLVSNSATAGQGIDMLREAFDFDRPRGVQQWSIYLLIRSRLIAPLTFAFYRGVLSAGAARRR